MVHLTVIKNSYIGLHDHMIPMMLNTKGPRLRNRTIERINPIVWMAWHILRCEDMYFNTIMFDLPQVYHRDNWKEKLKIKTNQVGTGMTVEEVNVISRKIDLGALFGYNQEMKSTILALLDQPPIPIDSPLDNEPLLYQRLKDTDSFPEEMCRNRAKAYAPFDVSSGLVGIISHAYMHIGQYNAITKSI